MVEDEDPSWKIKPEKMVKPKLKAFGLNVTMFSR